MTKKNLTILASAVVLFSCQEKQPERPNIVLIMADDLGFSDLGSYGGEIQTPNLDFMAEKGIRFTQFTNAAKCFPSRGNLLTGLYAIQCGMGEGPGYLTNAVTLGEVLQSVGYRTLMAGKHHGLENMTERGFHHYYGLRDGACNYFNPGEQREGEPVPAHKTWAKPRKWVIDDVTLEPYTPQEKDFYTTDYFTKYALSWLDKYKDEDNPFFLYLPYTAPHDPLQAWPEDIAKYEGIYEAGYEAIRNERYRRQLELGLIDHSWPLSEAVHPPWESLSEDEKRTQARKMQVFAAMIDRMDQNIGLIIDQLRETGKYENTVFMFVSDNGGSPGMFPEDGYGYNPEAREGEIGSINYWASLGPYWSNVSNTPYRYFKDWSHHGGSCTPFILYWPGKQFQQFSHYPGHFIDFMPTFLEWSGAEYPEEFNGQRIFPMEGESFTDALFHGKEEREKPLFWLWQYGKAVRKGDYRLAWESYTEIVDPYDFSEGPDDQPGQWRLYDMRTDKTETTDLSDRYPEIVEQLKTLYYEWEDRMHRGMD